MDVNLLVILLQAATDTVAVDTTSAGYQLGYKIGSYLPLVLFMGAAIFFISRAYRFKE